MSGAKPADSAAQAVARDIAEYLVSIASQHAGRVTRHKTAMGGGSEESTAFVLRRCAEDIADTYNLDGRTTRPTTRSQPFAPDVTAANHTFRNRATW